MQQRSVPVSIVLTIITCGLYGIYWFIVLTDDVNMVSGDNSTSGVMAFLFSLITCGIYTIYWSYVMGKRLNTVKEQRGIAPDQNMPIIYLVLSVLGLDIVNWALIQDDLNKLAPNVY